MAPGGEGSMQRGTDPRLQPLPTRRPSRSGSSAGLQEVGARVRCGAKQGSAGGRLCALVAWTRGGTGVGGGTATWTEERRHFR
jgi:hypothetical protein